MLTMPISHLSAQETVRLLNRSTGLSDVMPSVNPILEDVRKDGDAALRKYTLQFDRANIKDIEVSHKDIHEAVFLWIKTLFPTLKRQP